MSGLWACTIYTNKDVGIPPVVNVDNKDLRGQFTGLYCYVDVHVRLLKTPQTVLINNIAIPTVRSSNTEEEFDHSAVYHYINGDIVTVQCLPGTDALKDTENRFPIEFKYDFAENLDNMFKEQLEGSRSKLFGFRTKLQARHDKSVMVCKYHGKNDYTTIKVTFVLETIPDSVGYITINKSIARPFQDYDGLNSEVNYFSFDGEKVEIACTSNQYYLRAADKQENCETGVTTFTKSLITPFVYNCYLCVKWGRNYNIKVSTNRLHSDFKENKRLYADLPGDNILIELFKYDGEVRNSWIYYEFEEGDRVQPNCNYSKDKRSQAVLEVVYNFNNKELKTSEQLTLTSGHDNVFDCVLRDKVEASDSQTPIIARIKFLFRKRPQTTTTMTTSTSTTVPIVPKITEAPLSNSTAEQVPPIDGLKIPIWAVVAIAVLMCVVLTWVIITICKMRKNNQKRESSSNNYENLQNQNSQTSIPPYPEQWSRTEEQNYHVPADIRNDSNIYAEPVKGPDDPYATPIPKSQRPPRGLQDNPGLTYAELNSGGRLKTPPSNFEDPQYSSVKELYTQVVPKDQRLKNKNNYGNVFPDSRYVNSGNAEYVEPTYCQPYKK